MDLDQKFQQRWEYRRKEDEVDSSSDDSKSSLGDEPVRKKHKLVSNLNLPEEEEEDEAIDNLNSQNKNQVDSTKHVHFQIAEANKKHLASGKEKIAVDHKSKRNYGKTRKRKVSNRIQDQEAALLNDLKIFTESLLKDLKVAREKMFVQMKKQITKLLAAKPVSKPRRSSCSKKSNGAMHQTGNKSGTKIQSCNGKLEKGSKKENLGFDSRKSSKAITGRTNHEKAALESNRMEKRETLSLPGNKPVELVKDSDQIGSSYLALPTLLPMPQTESLSTDSSLHDHIECGFPVSIANNAERENSILDANNNYSYLLGIQQDEQFGNFAQIASKSISFLGHQNSQASSMVSGLSAFNQWSNNCSNITSQSALKDPAQENNTTSLRMTGGAIGFPGISHALSECFVANTISCNLNYDTNTDGGLVSFRSGEVKRDHPAHK